METEDEKKKPLSPAAFAELVFQFHRLLPGYGLLFTVDHYEWSSSVLISACFERFGRAGQPVKIEHVSNDIDHTARSYPGQHPEGPHYLHVAPDADKHMLCVEPDVFLDNGIYPEHEQYNSVHNNLVYASTDKNYTDRTFRVLDDTDEFFDGNYQLKSDPFHYSLDLQCSMLDLIYPDGYNLYGVKKAPLYRLSEGSMRDNAAVIALGTDGLILERLDRAYKCSPDAVMLAVKNNGDALQFAAQVLRDDHDIVKAAVSQTDTAFQYAGCRLKYDYSFLIELLKVAPTALAQLSDIFRDDVFIVSTAIEVDRSVLRYASARLQSLLDEPPVAWVK
jgi:hypothetical protein